MAGLVVSRWVDRSDFSVERLIGWSFYCYPRTDRYRHVGVSP